MFYKIECTIRLLHTSANKVRTVANYFQKQICYVIAVIFWYAFKHMCKANRLGLLLLQLNNGIFIRRYVIYPVLFNACGGDGYFFDQSLLIKIHPVITGFSWVTIRFRQRPAMVYNILFILSGYLYNRVVACTCCDGRVLLQYLTNAFKWTNGDFAMA
jgi:hypothetical protein